MADQISIKTKQLPVLKNEADVNLEDRLIASHEMGNGVRSTVGIPISVLADRFTQSDLSSMVGNKSLFGANTPDPDIGSNGDVYYQMSSGAIIASYVKYQNEWLFLAITDDNWARFLAGETYDIISFNATVVGDYAFYEEDRVRNVFLPICTEIGRYAFAKSSITGLNVPGIETIKENAFSEVTDLEGFIDLSNCKRIEDRAFYKANGLHTGQTQGFVSFITIRDVEYIGDEAFCEGWVLNRGTADPVELYLPECTHIGEYAFRNYRADGARKCYTDIILPKIETLGDHALQGIVLQGDLPANKTVKIGPYVTNMGTAPSYGNQTNNWDFYIEATTPPTLGSGLDTDGSKKPHKIYVPSDSVNTYKSHAVWGQYSSVIEALPPDYTSITERED